MPSRRESDTNGTTTKGESKRGRFGDKKQTIEKKQTLEKARRILELADKLKQNPTLRSIKERQATIPLVTETPKDPEQKEKRAPLPSQEEKLAEARGLQFFDPHVVQKPDRSRRRNFVFVQDGQYQQEAELERLRLKYGDDVANRVDKGQVRGLRGVKWEDIQRYLDAGQKKYDIEAIREDIQQGGHRRDIDDMEMSDDDEQETDVEEEIPNIEWWDENVLEDDAGDAYPEEPFPIKTARISLYIEHPVPIEPPGEGDLPPPQPLKLTKKEMRKLRTQRRQQREKDKQELIKQGLLEPPKPKVKLSNMMRVLADEAVTDPTAIEREIRKQQNERQKAHEDRSLARKLTPGERKSKKLKKLFANSSDDIHVCVFKVADLTNTKTQFKVTVNAEENRLTGCCLLAKPFSLVVVEGCDKATTRYKKLMLRRIKWHEKLDIDDDLNDAMDTEQAIETASYGCYLVWEGFVKERAFGDFKMDECRSEGMAKRYLSGFMVCHYWDLAKAFIPDDMTESKPANELSDT